MITLTRTTGEAISIGESIRVVITEVWGDKVRLGITAPPEMPVHREDGSKQVRQEGPPEQFGLPR